MVAENIYNSESEIICNKCGLKSKDLGFGEKMCKGCDRKECAKKIEQLRWINLCFPKLCECGCGDRLTDTKQFIRHHLQRGKFHHGWKVGRSNQLIKISSYL